MSSGYSSPCSESETDKLVFHESKDTKKVKRFLKDMDKDLDRIKERQSEIVSTEAPTLGNGLEVRKYALRASQIPTEDPGSEYIILVLTKLHIIIVSGCSNRTLGCWCILVGILIVIVFCILVGLMKIQHDPDTVSVANTGS